MFKKLSILATIACAFAFTGTVLADETAPAAAPSVAAGQSVPAMHTKTSIIGGTVVSVNAAAKQLVVKNSEGKMDDVTFDVGDKANIRKMGKEITLSDIVAGDKVMVAFKHKDDKRIATSIRVRAPKPAAEAPTVPATPAK